MERKQEPTAEEKARWEETEKRQKEQEDRALKREEALRGDSKKGSEKGKDEKVPVSDSTIFINLGSGTVMLTEDGDFNGRHQEGKMMISSQRVNKVTNGVAKAQYIPFPYTDCARLYQALKEHKEFIMKQVEQERKKILTVNMDD